MVSSLPVAFAFVFSLFSIIKNVASQTCLVSPPELPWTLGNGVYSGSITFDAATFTKNGVTFTTRVHNGMLPSPTLRMVAGETYELTLTNMLTDVNPSSTINVVKELDYTNIHTHGVHLTGEAPGDSVFTVVTPQGGPLTSYTYRYHIPCDHIGGTHWYHPHHHGSTTVQVGGGAAGALIIEDRPDEVLNYPQWYNDLAEDELVLVIQNLDLGKVAQVGGNLDNTFSTSSNTAFYTVNGEYQPSICLETHKRRKLRISHVDLQSSATFLIDSTSCTVELLARDGVLLETVPRVIGSHEMWFSVSSRADVAVQCSVAGTYSLVSGGVTVALFVVTNGDATPTTITPFSVTDAMRPGYLQDLRSYSGTYNTQTIGMSAKTIKGQKWSSPDNFLFEVDAGSVNEWTINGAGAHPFHVHINHFQIISNGLTGPSGWSQVGDWIDSLNTGATVRFRADRFGGTVVLHCHILEHEDGGAMAVYKINGGCNGDKADFGPPSAPACDWSCTAPAPTAPATTATPTTATPTSPPTTTTSTTTTTTTTTTGTASESPTTPSPTTPAPVPSSCAQTDDSCKNNLECCIGLTCSGGFGNQRFCE
eukprot:CAMPEP_0202701644 /NCGR_PEP_ID=MMETSP1385-20130828/14712_1 /ASSEMBLY_ACC=CAM_ASM_000861 /TAXON_ID=933848 /ORGANISM="Elphidium margaritaceum" /LENGTH=591 /DNA_ID=CAMNT_0049359107 /DNA_START=42 /DNA_END=1817 /DNA_ORIENTATION=-